MCFSILQVSYKADKERTMAKDQVLKVEVFRAQRIVSKREVLEEIPYKAPIADRAA